MFTVQCSKQKTSNLLLDVPIMELQMGLRAEDEVLLDFPHRRITNRNKLLIFSHFLCKLYVKAFLGKHHYLYWPKRNKLNTNLVFSFYSSFQNSPRTHFEKFLPTPPFIGLKDSAAGKVLVWCAADPV